LRLFLSAKTWFSTLAKFDSTFITFYSSRATLLFLTAISIFKTDTKFLLETISTRRVLNEINLAQPLPFMNSTTSTNTLMRVNIDCSVSDHSFNNTLYTSSLNINCLSYLALDKNQLMSILIPLKLFFEVTDAYFDTSYNSFNSQKVIGLPTGSKALRSFLYVLAHVLEFKPHYPHTFFTALLNPRSNINKFIFALSHLTNFLNLNKMYEKKIFFKQEYYQAYTVLTYSPTLLASYNSALTKLTSIY